MRRSRGESHIRSGFLFVYEYLAEDDIWNQALKCLFFSPSSITKARRFSVTLGKSAINETDDTNEQTFQVEEVIIHADFDNTEGNFNNDIG